MWVSEELNCCNPAVLKLESPSEYPGGLLNRFWTPSLEILIEMVSGGTQELAFLTSSQMMLKFQGPHLDFTVNSV